MIHGCNGWHGALTKCINFAHKATVKNVQPVRFSKSNLSLEIDWLGVGDYGMDSVMDQCMFFEFFMLALSFSEPTLQLIDLLMHA